MAIAHGTPHFQSDRAISEFEADRLDRLRFVESLTDAAASRETATATGITIGLVGRWGEGKTSVLQLVKKDLAERYPKAIGMDFSPWLVSQRHDLLHAFFDELIRAVGSRYSSAIHSGRRSQLVEELSGALADYVERIAPTFELIYPGSSHAAKIASFAMRTVSKIYRDRRAENTKLDRLKKRVECLLLELGVPIVVLVDEVDRIDNREIRELVHLVRAVADFPTVSYILAYDELRVAEALGHEAPQTEDRVARGRRYLEKIVQLAIPLPIVFDQEVASLLDEGIKGVVSDFGLPLTGQADTRYRELRSLLVPHLLPTTRDIRRLVGSFAHRLRLVAGEVEWPDVLGYLALSSVAPDLADRVRQAPDDFVFNGSIAVYSSKVTFDDRFKELTSERERQAHIKDLFAYLFPAISKKRTYADSFLDEIAFRRPLITLLRMNALSTAVSRTEVLAVAEMAPNDRRAFLAKIVAEGKAEAFAERLADLIRYRTINRSADIWIDLFVQIDRAPVNNWTDALSRMIAIRDTPDFVIALTSRDLSFEWGLRSIIESVSQTDAIEIASVLIRRVRLNISRGSEAFSQIIARAGINPEWLAEKAQEVLRRGIQRARDGHALLPVATVYLARDIGSWSPEDRLDYARVLQLNDQALDEFVLQSYGGNYSTDGTTIEDFFMPLDDFKARIRDRMSKIPRGDLELSQVYSKVFEFFSLGDLP